MCSSDSDLRDAKLKFLLPPSALKPAATAMASTRVDFPLPFSPIKNVTFLDDLDEALLSINPNLLEMRRGAWAALSAAHPDSIRQAAHSARELIDQVLKEGVSDEEIRSEPGFRPDPHSSSGITRRMRVKGLMRKHRGDVSDSDLKVVEEAGDFVLAIDEKLKAAAHSRSGPVHADVRESLEIAEKMLRRLLVPPSTAT